MAKGAQARGGDGQVAQGTALPRPDLQRALRQAVEHQQAGHVQEAGHLFRRILQLDPSNAEALYFLAMLRAGLGDRKTALPLMQRALVLKPKNASLQYHFGKLLREEGRAADAVEVLRRAVRIKANLPEAWYELGNAMRDLGKADDAIDAYNRAVKKRPEYGDAWLNLGNMLNQQGNLKDAADAFRKVVTFNTESAQGHLNLGACLDNMGRREEAITCYHHALVIEPNYVITLSNLGKALCEKGNFQEAVVELKRAVELKPDYGKAYLHLGRAHKMLGNAKSAVEAFDKANELGPDDLITLMELANAQRQDSKVDEAITTLDRVLELKPDYPEAYLNLGNALSEKGELDQAMDAFRKAIEIRPSHAEAHNNLGNAMQDRGRLNDAVECYKQALEHNPNFAMAHSNMLFCQQYNPDVSTEAQYENHIEFDRRFVQPLAREILPHANNPDPDRPIRVGYLSGSFHRHPVGFMITPSLRHADPEQIEIFCYSTNPRVDAVTVDIQKHSKAWRSLIGMDDRTAVEMIRRDEIDVLVDLAGHGSGARLLVLARKPAPVQVKWVGGLFNTTGISTIDYLITDWMESPEGFDKCFVEELVRLPDGYVCYDPPDYAPDVGPLPAGLKGYVTYGCFNNLAKVTPNVIALWSRIMREVPRSRIILKTKSLKEKHIRDNYMKMFADNGIAAERVDLREPSLHRALLDTYNEVDIALDPFPYTGGLTTCEAMWMGVPVLTMPGETFASRHAATHLNNVGLKDWIVDSEEAYYEEVVRRSFNLPALAKLRQGLRQQVAESPLLDYPRFADNLQDAYRMMWRRWCDKVAAGEIEDEAVAEMPPPDVGATVAADLAEAPPSAPAAENAVVHSELADEGEPAADGTAAEESAPAEPPVRKKGGKTAKK